MQEELGLAWIFTILLAKMRKGCSNRLRKNRAGPAIPWSV